MTDEVSVRELKTHLSDYLRRVREGESLVVTSRRRPLARLTPVPQPGTHELAWVGALQDVRWAGGKPRGGRRRPVISGKTAAARVLEDRR